MPEESPSEIIGDNFDVVMGKDHHVAGGPGKPAIVGLAKRARIVDLDDLEIAPEKQRLVVRPDTPALCLVSAADDYRNRPVVLFVSRWRPYCVERLPALGRR